MALVRGKLIQFASYIKKSQYEELKKLAERSEVAMADFIREGIDYILKKYRGKKWSW